MKNDRRQWVCKFCGYVYSEEADCPEEGIAAGTAWDNLPDDWCCPNCSAEISDFQQIENN